MEERERLLNITSGIHESVVGDLVRAFTETTNDVVNEIKQEYGLDTGNFKMVGLGICDLNALSRLH